MLTTISAERPTHALEFGLYRDGDNNLDKVQEATVAQARALSRRDPAVEFTVEDTTAQHRGHELHTDEYRIDGGHRNHAVSDQPHDMSARENLAAFVAHTLDNAEKAHAGQTWIDLVDHGGGDGGGLQADHGAGIMRADDIAGAIADGVALHAREHPEDAGRRVDGVVANQCLMATLAFSSALSHAGVRYLAASPETMLAPGVPTTVAEDITAHLNDPQAMACAMVDRTMDTAYGGLGGYGPSAAFNVLDLNPEKTAAVESSVRTLDAKLTEAAQDLDQREAIREDAQSIDGMVRFPDGKSLPWRADRPAIALYDSLANDTRLDPTVRQAASQAANAIHNTILAHRESADFAPFNDADYRDAVGPTVHFPLTPKQIDPWAPQMSETDNAFYNAVGADKLTHALA